MKWKLTSALLVTLLLTFSLITETAWAEPAPPTNNDQRLPDRLPIRLNPLHSRLFQQSKRGFLR